MSAMGTRLLTCAIAAVLSLLLSGCSDQRSHEDLPPLLKIGVLPDQDKEKLSERYEPLLNYLSEYLDIPCKLVVSDSYEGMLEDFGAGTVDLANFGAVTFVQANMAHNAVPLVMRDIDTRFTSYFVVKDDSPGTSIADYEDSLFAFGSRLSTSGHFYPRHFLTKQDMTPETFFREVRYSGAHDTTIEWVRNGVVPIGAVNSQIFRAMLADGRLGKRELRILWETPPYTDYVWAVQSKFGHAARTKIRDAFLALSPVNGRDKMILQAMGAGVFLPVNAESFDVLENMVVKLGLIQ